MKHFIPLDSEQRGVRALPRLCGSGKVSGEICSVAQSEDENRDYFKRGARDNFNWLWNMLIKIVKLWGLVICQIFNERSHLTD